jgi:hypothetical protein
MTMIGTVILVEQDARAVLLVYMWGKTRGKMTRNKIPLNTV